MIFEGVNHIAIIVSDLEKSAEFYRNVLGLKELHRIELPEKQSIIIYLDAGNCIVELFSFPSPPKRLSYPEAAGLRHLAFSTKDFNGAIADFDDRGITYEPIRVDARTNKKMTFIVDPDNLPIEISEV